MIALWIAVGALAVALAFVAFALAGAVRRVDELRREVHALSAIENTIEHPPSGLPVGAPAPVFEAEQLNGDRFVSSVLDGRRHLVVFADPGCAACHDLMPGLATASDLPPLVVSAGKGHDPWPDAWVRPAGTGAPLIVIRDPDDAVADAFRAGFTPHVFVVDEGGAVAAQGPADSADLVRALLREADAFQIVHSEPAGG